MKLVLFLCKLFLVVWSLFPGMIIFPLKFKMHSSIPLPQFSSVPQSCPTLWDPMVTRPPCPIANSRSLLKHVYWVDAIQPSHPLSSPSPAWCFCSIRVFSNESGLHIRWPNIGVSDSASVLPVNGLISFRMDWLDLLAVQGTQESSPTPQFKSINSSALSFLYSPTLTSIYDYWKNHSFD